MKNKIWLSVGALLLIQGMVVSGFCAEAYRQHTSHTHGVGKLQVAVDSNTLTIEMESPALNIVGFEYFPGNAEEEKRVHTATKLLHDGAQLFAPTVTARCQMTESHVDSELLLEKHDHDGQHSHGEKERHSEFLAVYTFVCKYPEALTHVDIHLFRHFPAMEELDVRFATTNGQGAVELTPDASRLTF